MVVDYGVDMRKLSRNGFSGQDPREVRGKSTLEQKRHDYMQWGCSRERDVDGRGREKRRESGLKGRVGKWLNRRGKRWDGDGERMGEGERRQVSPGDAVTRKLWAGPEMLRWTLGEQGELDRLPNLRKRWGTQRGKNRAAKVLRGSLRQSR